jgi:hypothetical protein
MISRERYDAIESEAREFAKKLYDTEGQHPGEKTVGEAVEDGSLFAALNRVTYDPAWQRRWSRLTLHTMLGKPDDRFFLPGRLMDETSGLPGLLNPHTTRVRTPDPDRAPETTAQLAASELSQRKVQNRIKVLREAAHLCDSLADLMSRRSQHEAQFRRIQ